MPNFGDFFPWPSLDAGTWAVWCHSVTSPGYTVPGTAPGMPPLAVLYLSLSSLFSVRVTLYCFSNQLLLNSEKKK